MSEFLFIGGALFAGLSLIPFGYKCIYQPIASRRGETIQEHERISADSSQYSVVSHQDEEDAAFQQQVMYKTEANRNEQAFYSNVQDNHPNRIGTFAAKRFGKEIRINVHHMNAYTNQVAQQPPPYEDHVQTALAKQQQMPKAPPTSMNTLGAPKTQPITPTQFETTYVQPASAPQFNLSKFAQMPKKSIYDDIGGNAPNKKQKKQRFHESDQDASDNDDADEQDIEDDEQTETVDLAKFQQQNPVLTHIPPPVAHHAPSTSSYSDTPSAVFVKKQVDISKFVQHENHAVEPQQQPPVMEPPVEEAQIDIGKFAEASQ